MATLHNLATVQPGAEGAPSAALITQQVHTRIQGGDLSLKDAATNELRSIVDVREPLNATDVATKQYVDSVAGEGMQYYQVSAVATTLVSLATPPASIDGVPLVGTPLAPMYVLLTNQGGANVAANGIYIYNGTTLARPASTADAFASAIGGVALSAGAIVNSSLVQDAEIFVQFGSTNGGSSWKQTSSPITAAAATDGAAEHFTIDTDLQQWVATAQINISALIARQLVKNERLAALNAATVDASNKIIATTSALVLAFVPIALTAGNSSESIAVGGSALTDIAGVDYTITVAAGVATVNFVNPLIAGDTVAISYFHA